MSVILDTSTNSGTASPRRELTADSTSGGFTAVNGKTTPPPNGVKMNGNHENGPSNGNTNGNGNGSRFDSPDGGYRSASMSSSSSPETMGKRKRGSTDEDMNAEPKRERLSPPEGLDQQYPQQPKNWHQDASEAHLAELLQHEQHAHSTAPAEYQHIRSSNDRPIEPVQTVEYNANGTMITTAAGVQKDPNRRKRNFSNRTKTGCQTCRRRKKKCDEAKPECQNCLRGGFVCEGYTPKHTWTKNNLGPKPSPMSIQPWESARLQQPPDNYARTSTQPNSAYGSTPNRPIQVEEDQEPPRPAAYTYPDPHRTYNDRPAPVEYSNHALPTSEPREVAQHRPEAIVYRPSPPTHAPINPSPAVTAQLALQHTAQLHRPTHTALSEKQKMQREEWYRPFSAELMSDRESCQSALWKFNNTMGVSRTERYRIFRDILRTPANRGNTSSTDHRVPMGENVYIEAPFHCEYGYNISIGHDVVISAGCFIQDACHVSIGDKCILSPGVKILSNTWSTNPAERDGSRGMARGKRIIIKENVLIGAGVIIKEGVTIGANCTIGPGKVITQDIGDGSTLN